MGILGILEGAAAKGLLDLPQTIDALRQKTNYRISNSVVAAVLQRDAKRRG